MEDDIARVVMSGQDSRIYGHLDRNSFHPSLANDEGCLHLVAYVKTGGLIDP